ncbi:MAG: FAD:protein FMN transferase [Tenericutes bacterium]|nr:FAD:protein FMN transferase [Mycoplasmatota bacterium]
MKKTILVLLLLLIMPLFIACNSSTQAFENPNTELCVASNTAGVFLCEKTTTSYFDTTVSLKLYYQASDSYDILEVFEYFENTLETYHQYFDKYHEYSGITNVYNINESTETLVLDDKLFQALVFAMDNKTLVVRDDTYLFNIALGQVLDVWHNARDNSNCNDSIELGILYCPVPNKEIDGITFHTNPDNVVLDAETNSISFLESDMSIDLGGYAKGYVANIVTDHLNSLDITYILNLGNSNVIGNGQNPTNDTSDFLIALIEPSTDFKIVNTYYQYVQLPEDMALVTSGNYQRFFKDIDTSEVYHHIIDPRTNYPGGDVMSVSIIYPDSAIADVLSTAIYLLDLEDAISFVNETENLEAVWYSYDGTITYSDGFQTYNYVISEQK